MGDKTKKIQRAAKKASYRSKGTGRSSMKTSGFDGKFISRVKVTPGWTEKDRARLHSNKRVQPGRLPETGGIDALVQHRTAREPAA